MENTFLETKPNFPLTGKCFSLTEKYFSLTNFSNDKQTQESLESGFPKTGFRETNAALGFVELEVSFIHNNIYTFINFNENNNIYNTNNKNFSSNNMNYYKNNFIYNTKYNNILETNAINYTKK